MPGFLPDRSPEDIEAAMKKVSVIVSSVAGALMIGGLAYLVASGESLVVPGGPVFPFPRFLHPTTGDLGILAMSAGIVLLGLLPSVRVLLALGIYVRRRMVLDIVVAIIVVVELLGSMAGGGR